MFSDLFGPSEATREILEAAREPVWTWTPPRGTEAGYLGWECCRCGLVNSPEMPACVRCAPGEEQAT